MANNNLWNLLKDLQSPKYKWVDLTHEFGNDTPRWPGFDPLDNKTLFDFDNAPMKVNEFRFPGQYGTHVDVPGHFVAGGRLVDEIDVSEFAYQLCVIDATKQVSKNVDYALTVQDILDWESEYGQIPEGAFVAMRSDWSKRWSSQEESLNIGSDEISHYPGWHLDALEFLFKERNIGAIGHEPFDTDPPALKSQVPFKGEHYVLAQDKFQIEVLNNLDAVPETGAIIFATFPKVKNATGFPARVFAIYES